MSSNSSEICPIKAKDVLIIILKELKRKMRVGFVLPTHEISCWGGKFLPRGTKFPFYLFFWSELSWWFWSIFYKAQITKDHGIQCSIVHPSMGMKCYVVRKPLILCSLDQSPNYIILEIEVQCEWLGVKWGGRWCFCHLWRKIFSYGIWYPLFYLCACACVRACACMCACIAHIVLCVCIARIVVCVCSPHKSDYEAHVCLCAYSHSPIMMPVCLIWLIRLRVKWAASACT